MFRLVNSTMPRACCASRTAASREQPLRIWGSGVRISSGAPRLSSSLAQPKIVSGNGRGNSNQHSGVRRGLKPRRDLGKLFQGRRLCRRGETLACRGGYSASRRAVIHDTETHMTASMVKRPCPVFDNTGWVCEARAIAAAGAGIGRSCDPRLRLSSPLMEFFGERDETHEESSHLRNFDDCAPGPPPTVAIPEAKCPDFAGCARQELDIAVRQRVPHEPD
jgi:hypothetical protein